MLHDIALLTHGLQLIGPHPKAHLAYEQWTLDYNQRVTSV